MNSDESFIKEKKKKTGEKKERKKKKNIYIYIYAKKNLTTAQSALFLEKPSRDWHRQLCLKCVVFQGDTKD